MHLRKAHAMARELDSSIHALRRRAILASFLGEWSIHALVALFVAGAAALLLRLLAGWPVEQAAWALALVALTPMTAWLRARQRFMSREAVAAWLDVRAGATGMLLAERETGDERWKDRAEALLAAAPANPKMRLQPAAVRSGTGIAFAALVLMVPMPDSATGLPSSFYDSALDTLHEKLETLEEEVELEPDESAQLHEQLERLESEVKQEISPEASFEAIDQLAGEMENSALEAQESIEQAAEALSESQADQSQAKPEDAQDALERALSKLAEAGLLSSLPEGLAAKLGQDSQLPPGITLDISEMGALSDELRDLLAAKVGKLVKAGLLNPKALKKLAKLGDLSEFKEHSCPNCGKPGGM